MSDVGSRKGGFTEVPRRESAMKSFESCADD